MKKLLIILLLYTCAKADKEILIKNGSSKDVIITATQFISETKYEREWFGERELCQVTVPAQSQRTVILSDSANEMTAWFAQNYYSRQFGRCCVSWYAPMDWNILEISSDSVFITH